MERHYGAAERIWVMDRGMVSEQNIAFLRQSGRRYIIGTPRQSLRRFEQHLVEQDWREVHHGVEVKLCASPDGADEVFILCRSAERARKEQGIHDRFATRLEADLRKLQDACKARRGKDISKVIERRLGRLLKNHSRAASLFGVSVRYDEQSKQTVVEVDRKDDRSHWLRRTEGYYLLRSNITDWKPEELWTAYIHLTDAEEAFHIHKSDLAIRPIWHHKDERIKAHILVCFLAFVLWKAFGLMCKNAGLGDEPRRVFEELCTIAMVDVVLSTTDGGEMKIRTITKPDKPLQVLLHKLGLRLPERLTKRVL
jgi:transposase